MKNIRDLHKEAMNYAGLAFMEKSKGQTKKAGELFKKAYLLEKEAALAIPQDTTSELTRAVLFRSAAALALDCQEFREAEKMVGMGLAGEPPTEILEELRDVYKKIIDARETTGIHEDLRDLYKKIKVARGPTEVFKELKELYMKLKDTCESDDHVDTLETNFQMDKVLIDAAYVYTVSYHDADWPH